MSNNKKINLSLSGMHCSSCALLIERSLKKVPGVSQANVNLSAEKAMVTFNEAEVKPQKLIDAVVAAGYQAELVDASDKDFERRKQDQEIKSYARKFWSSFAFSLPMAFFMVLDFVATPINSAVMPYMGLLSLLLTIESSVAETAIPYTA